MLETRCPKCRSTHGSRVIDSRASQLDTVRRRRACLDCNARWTTFEVSEERQALYVELEKRLGPLTRERIAELVETERAVGFLMRRAAKPDAA